jgi:hypothetical protein
VQQVKELTQDVAGMEAAKDRAFAPPPKAWIVDRVAKLQALLAQRTEASALALRRLTGPVTLTPEKPQVGRAYFRVRCKVDCLNLLVAEDGSNLLQWRRGRDSNPAIGVGNNLKRHATLRANAVKRNANWVRNLLSAGRREST